MVEPFRRGELDYFFAYPEDYSQQETEWVDGEFERRPHTPAFEVIFVYSQKDGTLDLNFRGARKAMGPLQGMFATTILKLGELPPDPKDERIYDLGLLGKATPLHLYNVIQVEIAASVVVDADKPARIIPIRITYPNSCSLKYDELGMTPEDALIELLDRVAALRGASTHISAMNWLSGLVKPSRR